MISVEPVSGAPWQDVAGLLGWDEQGDPSHRARRARTIIIGGWIARSDAKMVGSALIVRNPAGQLEIGMVAVDPSYRRRGIARTLVGRRLSDAAAFDERVILISERSNDPARELYASLGFLMTDEVPHDQDSSSRFVVWTHPWLIHPNQ